MNSSSEPAASGDDSARANAERVSSFIRNVPAVFVDSIYLVGGDATVRFVIGQQIENEFCPSGHIIMTLESLQLLLEASGKHLEKVAVGRIGVCAGSA